MLSKFIEEWKYNSMCTYPCHFMKMWFASALLLPGESLQFKLDRRLAPRAGLSPVVKTRNPCFSSLETNFDTCHPVSSLIVVLDEISQLPIASQI
jgi:hypothetical protein